MSTTTRASGASGTVGRALGVLLVAALVAAIAVVSVAAALILGLGIGGTARPSAGVGPVVATPAASAASHRLSSTLPSARKHSVTSPLIRRAAAGLVAIVVDSGGAPSKAGTGIVLSAGGTVLTNYHVISTDDETSRSIRVEDPATATTYEAVVLGADRRHDIAVLRLRDAQDLPTAPIGRLRGLRIGQRVTSVGNAYGAGQLAASSGVISGLGASIASTTETSRVADNDTDSGADSEDEPASRLTGLIQVSALIVPGDSGGALLDARGRVVALTVAYAHRGDTSAGIGWAIPIDTALRIARDLSTN
jgi:S1-C subfamily serine protease